MTARTLDGRKAAALLLGRLRRTTKYKLQPTLATVVIGTRYDSLLYVRLKESAAKSVGLRSHQVRLPATVSQRRLLAAIKELNRRPDITGILLQLPLPSHLETEAVIAAIDHNKDADGLRADARVDSPFLQAIVHLVKLGRPSKGPTVILAQDTVFAQRLAAALKKRGQKVIVASAKERIPLLTRHATCVITLLGRGPRLRAADIQRGAVIIDGGIRQREGRTIGDADTSVWSKAKAISPVPGGVGPLTIAYLLRNTIVLAKRG